MRSLAPVVLCLALAQFSPTEMSPAERVAPPSRAERDCGSSGMAFVRTTLYFGLSRPAGPIRKKEWAAFLREHVTPRFPSGLTVWEADGQWRRADGSIGRERAKLLLVVHDGKAAARAALSEVVSRYKQMFNQESVLWESASVCAAF